MTRSAEQLLHAVRYAASDVILDMLALDGAAVVENTRVIDGKICHPVIVKRIMELLAAIGVIVVVDEDQPVNITKGQLDEYPVL